MSTPKNITINCVSPGFIVSDMTTNIAEKLGIFNIENSYGKTWFWGRCIGNCVAFLSSELASYVTGETIHVNGGMYMS